MTFSVPQLDQYVLGELDSAIFPIAVRNILRENEFPLDTSSTTVHVELPGRSWRLDDGKRAVDIELVEDDEQLQLRFTKLTSDLFFSNQQTVPQGDTFGEAVWEQLTTLTPRADGTVAVALSDQDSDLIQGNLATDAVRLVRAVFPNLKVASFAGNPLNESAQLLIVDELERTISDKKDTALIEGFTYDDNSAAPSIDQITLQTFNFSEFLPTTVNASNDGFGILRPYTWNGPPAKDVKGRTIEIVSNEDSVQVRSISGPVPLAGEFGWFGENNGGLFYGQRYYSKYDSEARMATMYVEGDLQIAADTIRISGGVPLSIVVGGDIVIDSGAEFNRSVIRKANENPFLPNNARSPNIASLQGGCQAFGLLSNSIATVLNDVAIFGSAPDNAALAAIRLEDAWGPGGLGCALESQEYVGYDMVLIANLSDVDWNGIRLGVGENPPTQLVTGVWQRNADGELSEDTHVLASLAGGAVYATLIPESVTTLTVQASIVDGSEKETTFKLADDDIVYLTNSLRVPFEASETDSESLTVTTNASDDGVHIAIENNELIITPKPGYTGFFEVDLTANYRSVDGQSDSGRSYTESFAVTVGGTVVQGRQFEEAEEAEGAVLHVDIDGDGDKETGEVFVANQSGVATAFNLPSFSNLPTVYIDMSAADVGDTIATALDTMFDSSQQVHVIDSQIGDGDQRNLDVDLYKFNVEAGDTVTLRTRPISGRQSMDTILRLFEISIGEESPWTEIAVNDDFGSLYSQINYTFATAGTYYVGVSGYPNLNYDPFEGGSGVTETGGDYRLTIAKGGVDSLGIDWVNVPSGDPEAIPPTSAGIGEIISVGDSLITSWVKLMTAGWMCSAC
ncbi:MAG: PPC domain-containing protein [Pirellulaceae bacterium]